MFNFSTARSSEILCVSLGAACLALPAALNGFPFIFPDSGDYLVLHPLIYRSPYYGLLISFFHLNRYIWMPVVMQCVVVSHLLWLLSHLLIRPQNSAGYLVVIVILTFFSSLPFFTGFIMADIFTPIMFLTMYIIGFHFSTLSRPLQIYLLLLDGIATAAHISNLALGFGLFLLFAFFLLAVSPLKALQPLAWLGIPLASTAIAIFLFNVIIFGSWSLSPAGQSFLLANMIQNGPARDYLQEACPAADYKICAYANQFPSSADELLWSTPIFHNLGGFSAMQSEAKEIVRQTIRSHPREVFKTVAHNFIAGLAKHEPAAEFYSKYQVSSFPELLALKFGASTLFAYQNSAEMRDSFPHKLIRTIDSIVFPTAFVTLIVLTLYAYRGGDTEAFIFLFSILCFILGDTLLCTSLSGIHDRYQARVTWLAPLGTLILFQKFYYLNKISADHTHPQKLPYRRLYMLIVFPSNRACEALEKSSGSDKACSI